MIPLAYLWTKQREQDALPHISDSTCAAETHNQMAPVPEKSVDTVNLAVPSSDATPAASAPTHSKELPPDVEPSSKGVPGDDDVIAGAGRGGSQPTLYRAQPWTIDTVLRWVWTHLGHTVVVIAWALVDF